MPARLKSRTPPLLRKGKWFRKVPTPHLLWVNGPGSAGHVVYEILSHAGFRCETVSEGTAALARLMTRPADIDVLIADHDLPAFNGLGLVAQLRQSGFDRRIVVHSSCLQRRERAGYEALRVDAIFAGPVDTTTLLQTISE